MCRITNQDLCPVVSFATGLIYTWDSLSALWCPCSQPVKWSSILGGVVSSCSIAKVVGRNGRAGLLQLWNYIPGLPPGDSILKSNEELCITCLVSARGSYRWIETDTSGTFPKQLWFKERKKTMNRFIPMLLPSAKETVLHYCSTWAQITAGTQKTGAHTEWLLSHCTFPGTFCSYFIIIMTPYIPTTLNCWLTFSYKTVIWL